MEMNYKRQINVLGIVGSPRQGGNTDNLVEEILRGASDAGAQVEKCIISNLNIKPCKACDVCVSKRDCIIQDDMSLLLEKMDKSQVWVLGTPVYWWGPSAQIKSFIDRWHGAHRKIKFEGHQIVLAIPLESPKQSVADYTIDMLRETINWLKADLFATVVAPGVYEKGEVLECISVMFSAYETGKNVVNKISKSTL